VLAALYTLQVAIRLITEALEDRDEMGDFPSSKVSLGFDRRLEMFTCRRLVQITWRGCLTGPARRGPNDVVCAVHPISPWVHRV
jgi:hypothetical protein